MADYIVYCTFPALTKIKTLSSITSIFIHSIIIQTVKVTKIIVDRLYPVAGDPWFET